ncbi:leucine-rich repeat domain-containing protein [Flavobacterium sp. WV_118_3]|uniref:leucine-rich repeat domain-containing protein n=1 Tax=Flavobacterium sp. WV_118_3 TaxID=3151764 RepID=UPI003219E54C
MKQNIKKMANHDDMTLGDLLKKAPKKSIFSTIGQLFKKKPLTFEKALKNPLKHTSLDLRNQNLKELPESIGQFKNLRQLYLDNNQLTSLPDAIGDLPQLDLLTLRNNQLTSLPDTIGNLSTLTYIDLKNNQLTSLPDAIGKLTRLTNIDLESNQLKTLPDSICSLTRVYSFNAANNQLTQLPELFGNMTQIQVLNLHHNQLTHLPESLGNLKETVVYFNISSNRLKTLPNTLHKVVFEDIYLDNNELESLGTLGQGGYRIDQLHLKGNPLLTIPETLSKRPGLWLSL